MLFLKIIQGENKMKKRIIGIENEYRIQALPGFDKSRYKVYFRGLKISLNQFLSNGARFYLDFPSELPEYCTPEVTTIREVLAHERAGDYIVWESLKDMMEIFRRNTSQPGLFYKYLASGCHENYLFYLDEAIKSTANIYPQMSGHILARLVAFLGPFLVSRQIFCGAGWWLTNEDGRSYFNISQRAHFMKRDYGGDTMQNRAIINSRNESLCSSSNYSRLHLIVGDSNMSDLSGFLKLGTTSIVLRMIEAGFFDPQDIVLVDPVAAIAVISDDLSCKATVQAGGLHRSLSAIDIQEWYLNKAREFFECREVSEEEKEVIKYWQEVLDKLRRDPMLLKEEIDWVIKYNLICRYAEKHGVDLDHCSDEESEALRVIDTHYHSLNPERGLYHKLLGAGKIAKLISDKEVALAIKSPPTDTRAKVRGDFISFILKNHADLVRYFIVNWDAIRYNYRANGFSRLIHEFQPNQDDESVKACVFNLGDPFLSTETCNNFQVLVEEIESHQEFFKSMIPTPSPDHRDYE